MAYNSFSYYETGREEDRGEYYLTPYAHDHNDSAPISYSSYEDPSFQNLLEYEYPNPTPYFHANYHTASAYSNPISIQYHPPKFYEQSITGVASQYFISYSVSPEFNDPEIDDYDEYDPTPYGGGYNITSHYGKPLPPSNKTCYPRGGSAASGNNAPSVSSAIVPVSPEEAIADEQPAKPIKDISQETQRDKEEKPSQVLAIENGNDTSDHGKSNQVEVYNSGSGNGRGLYDQVPSGYGLEAMDICESLFGYWPCLVRDLKRSNNVHSHQFACEGRHENPWEGTAEYLFGSSNPYGEERRTYYEYETHYLEQNQHEG